MLSAIAATEDVGEQQALLRYLFTAKELFWAADRWYAACVLQQPNMSQRRAVKMTGLNAGKVARAAREMVKNGGICRVIQERTKHYG